MLGLIRLYCKSQHLHWYSNTSDIITKLVMASPSQSCHILQHMALLSPLTLLLNHITEPVGNHCIMRLLLQSPALIVHCSFNPNGFYRSARDSRAIVWPVLTPFVVVWLI